MPQSPDKNNINNVKRLFIAIDLPLNVKSYLHEQAKKYFGSEKAVRIIPAENIHLTLKFLGDTNTSKIQKVSMALKETAGNFNGFDFELSSKFEAFPSVYSPRILFGGAGPGSDKIKQLFHVLENNLAKIRIKKEERGFVSHITVARVRGKVDLSAIYEIAELSYPGALHCDRLTLFESKLNPAGALYTIIEEFALK